MSDISAVVKKGRQGTERRYTQFPAGMPPQSGLSDEDIKAIIAYEKSIAG